MNEQDDAGDDEREQDSEAAETAPPEKPRRARARKATEDDVPPAGDISPFGHVPLSCTHWGIRRAGISGQWETPSWGEPGSTVEAREWPIADLSVDNVLARWGEGVYQVQFLTVQGRGGRKHISYGRIVKLKKQAPAATAPAATAPAMPTGLEGLTLAMQLTKLIGSEADAKVNGFAQMAQLMGQKSSGLGAAELELILQRQAAAHREDLKTAVAAAVAPLQAKLDALEGDDDDDEENPVMAAARAAAPMVFKGKGVWSQIANFAMANPKIAEQALPLVTGTINGLFSIIKNAQPPAQQTPTPPAQMVASSAPPPARARASAPAAASPAPNGMRVDAAGMSTLSPMSS
jgi:hypothetical protein